MYKQVPAAMLADRSQELEEYFKWALDNGVRLYKASYPCLFPPGYLGMVANEEVGSFEPLISVPNDVLITSHVAENSELGDLFREYDEFFDEDDVNYEDMVLVSYLIWEKFKGERSKWFHFIRNQPKSFDILQDWSVEELQMLQDAELVFDTKQQIAGCLKKYGGWKKVMLKSKVFTPDMTDYKEFVWVYRLLATRSFGKFCPHTTFAPIAEFFNHHNTASYYYYGTNEASSESAKRYTNFFVGQDHDDDLILRKPVCEVSWKKVVKLVLQRNVERDSPLFKLIKEAEANDSEDRQRREVDYGKPDPELLRETSEKSLSIITGSESYEAGSQLYMSYGRYSNRMLLSTYGFALEDNVYDYARIIVPFDSLCPEENSGIVRSLDNGNVYMFKVKSNAVCKELLKITRVLNWNEGKAIDACFSPADAEQEIKVIGIVKRILNEKLQAFPTSYEQDQALLSQSPALRAYFAVIAT